MYRKRCRRANEPGDAHELTFSCYRRLPLLSRDRSRFWMVEAITAARRAEGFDLWAYVLMPEHVHLLLQPRDPAYDISRVLWRIKRPVGRRAIAHLERNAPRWLAAKLTVIRPNGTRERRFWQAGGGYDRNILATETVLNLIAYLHLNPVRRGLVQRPEDWEWSSARWYGGIRPVPLEMDATLPPVVWAVVTSSKARTATADRHGFGLPNP